MRRGRKSAWIEKIQPRLDQIAYWCRSGFTDDQIAEALGVGRSTFLRYKTQKQELRDALKVNKEIADLSVENSLFKRAMGYEYEEETIEGIVGPNGETIKKTRKIVKKIMAPDTTAQIFWLKNRQPEKWRDKHHHEITGEGGGEIPIKWIKSDDD